MEEKRTVLERLIEKIAVTNAESASSFFMFEPELPEELKKKEK